MDACVFRSAPWMPHAHGHMHRVRNMLVVRSPIRQHMKYSSTSASELDVCECQMEKHTAGLHRGSLHDA